MVKKTIELASEYGEWWEEFNNETSVSKQYCNVFSIYNGERFRATVYQTLSNSNDLQHESELVRMSDSGIEEVVRVAFSTSNGRSSSSIKAVKRVPGSIRFERRLPKRAWQAMIGDYLNSVPEEESTDLVPSRKNIIE